MFILRTLTSGTMIGPVLTSYGLDDAAKRAVWRDRRNASLLINGRAPADQTAYRGNRRIFIPITVTLAWDLVAVTNPNGLLAQEIGSTAPPMCTHGARVLIKRNLAVGANIAWLQTARRENDPSLPSNAPFEFVDTGGTDSPFTPPDIETRRFFEDTPCGLAGPAGSPGLKWTGTTTLVARHRTQSRPEKIALLAGVTWGFEIVNGQVMVQSPQTASQADYAKQLRLLRIGLNQLNRPTGGHLDYVRPDPSSGAIQFGP